MNIGQQRRLSDIYRSLLLPILILFSISGYSQYNPSLHIVVNEAIAPAQATPTDSRSMFYDATNFVYRPYQSTAEVLGYLNLSKYRTGNFTIVIDSGGSLQSNGTFIGGVNTFWQFKDGTANGNLVEMSLFGNTGCGGCLLAANNLSDLANAGTARSNLGLGTMAIQSTTALGTDISGTWPGALTVNSIQGHNLSYLQNYANLTNTPPGLSLVVSGTSGPSTYNSSTGVLTIPNYTGGGGGSCLNCNADTIGHIALNFVSFPNNSVLTLDSVTGTASWQPATGGVATIPPNIGSGFRIYSPQVPGFRSLVCASGCTIDSTTNSNSLTLTVTSSGVGTVTSFSAVNISGFATQGVTNATTTPQLTYTLLNASAYNIWGNNTASPTTPFYFAPNLSILNQWAGGNIPLLGSNNIWTGLNTFNGGVVLGGGMGFSVDNTWSIGSSLLGAANIWSRFFQSNSQLNLQSGASSIISLNSGGSNGVSIQNTGQVTLRQYTSPTSFTGTPTSIAEFDASGNLIQGSLITQIGAVQGLHASVTGDSVLMGGFFYQPDTVSTLGYGFAITGLPNEATLGAGDSVLVEKAGSKYLTLVPSSAIGGGGAVSSVSDNGTGTLTISPNTGAVLAGVNQGFNFAWTGSQTWSSPPLPASDDAIDLGGGTGNHWRTGYIDNVKAHGILTLGAASGSYIAGQINGVNKFEILSTGQGQLNGYTANSSFPVTAVGMLVFDASGNIGTQAISGGADSAIWKNNGTYTANHTLVMAGFTQTFTGGKNFFDSIGIVIPPMLADSVVFFDNSIGVGVGVLYNIFRYTTVLCAKLRAKEANRSGSGETMQFDGNNLIPTIPTFGPLYRYLVIGYLENDVDSIVSGGTGPIDTAHCGPIYRKFVDTAIARGWPPSRIFLRSFGWTAIGQGATPARRTAYFAMLQSIATTRGCNFVDCYNPDLAHDSTVLKQEGVLHPNQWGAALFAQNIYNAMPDSVRALGQGIATNRVAEFQKMKYDGMDMADTLTQVMGIKSDGTLAKYTKDAVIVNGFSINQPQAASIDIGGNIYAGDAPASSPINKAQPENIIAKGGINGGFLRATSGLPGGLTGAGVEMANLNGTQSYLAAYNRTSAIPMDLVLQLFGGSLLVGTQANNGLAKEQISGKLSISTVDSVASPANMLWIDPSTGLVKKAAVPTVAGNPCLNCSADSIKTLPVDTSLRRNGYALTFDSVNHKWVLAPILSTLPSWDATLAIGTTTQRLPEVQNPSVGVEGLIIKGSYSANNVYAAAMAGSYSGTNSSNYGVLETLSGSAGTIKAVKWASDSNFTILCYPVINQKLGIQLPGSSTFRARSELDVNGTADSCAVTMGWNVNGGFYNRIKNYFSNTPALNSMNFQVTVGDAVPADNLNVMWLKGNGKMYTLPQATGTTSDSVVVWHAADSAYYHVAQSSLGGGVTTVGSFSGSGIPNGASISGSTITFGPADATHPGMVSTGTQTLAGNKLLTGNIDIGGSSVPANSLFTIEGNSSYFPSGNSGARLNSATGTTNTDAVTTGTSAANMWIYSLNAPTLAATNTGVTYPIAATLFVNTAPSAGTNVTLTNAYSIYANGNSFINGNLSSATNSVATFSHFVGNSSTPTIAAGTGAGTGPTVSITGTDQDGVISVTAGTTPGTSATVATITFSLAFPTNTFPVLTPANSNSALLSGVTMVYTTGTTTNFTITSGTTALTSTLQYKWYYHTGAN